MTKPAKITVIVTRPEPDGSAFARLAESSGMTALLSPVAGIVLKDVRAEIAGAGALAFSSANGLRSYLASKGSRRPVAYCVGERTAAAAREGGFATVRSAEGDVRSLEDLISSELQRDVALVHVAGRDESGDLSGELRRRGFIARRVVAYAAEPEPGLASGAVEAMKGADPLLWVAHFSARSARLFEDLAARAGVAEMAAKAGAACLSPTVAGALGLKWRNIVVAERPDGAALIDAIRKAR